MDALFPAYGFGGARPGSRNLPQHGMTGHRNWKFAAIAAAIHRANSSTGSSVYEILVTTMMQAIDRLPGYRRRIRVEPCAGTVRAMLEDDFHCMAVTLRHQGGVVTAVEPEMERWPWTTCPGAREQLIRTFVGLPLAEVTARREKRANCTHLHDLAVLAAAHAGDDGLTVWDVLVSDPVAGERVLELRRGGLPVLRWLERDGLLAEPESAKGLALPGLRDWIAGLARAEREAAQLLQWAAIVAHGRTIPFAQQSRAEAMPPSCYTFQPERARQAVRVGVVRDFSAGGPAPLDR